MDVLPEKDTFLSLPLPCKDALKIPKHCNPWLKWNKDFCPPLFFFPFKENFLEMKMNIDFSWWLDLSSSTLKIGWFQTFKAFEKLPEEDFSERYWAPPASIPKCYNHWDQHQESILNASHPSHTANHWLDCSKINASRCSSSFPAYLIFNFLKVGKQDHTFKLIHFQIRKSGSG